MAAKAGDEFDDDVVLQSEVRILRRIPPGNTAPKVNGSLRPSSNCFGNHPDGSGTSVDIWDDAHDPKDTLKGHAGFGLAWLTVGEVRELGLGVCPDPIGGNSRHALIQGKKTGSRKNRLARLSRWIELPEPAA